MTTEEKQAIIEECQRIREHADALPREDEEYQLTTLSEMVADLATLIEELVEGKA